MESAGGEIQLTAYDLDTRPQNKPGSWHADAKRCVDMNLAVGEAPSKMDSLLGDCNTENHFFAVSLLARDDAIDLVAVTEHRHGHIDLTGRLRQERLVYQTEVFTVDNHSTITLGTQRYHESTEYRRWAVITKVRSQSQAQLPDPSRQSPCIDIVGEYDVSESALLADEDMFAKDWGQHFLVT